MRKRAGKKDKQQMNDEACDAQADDELLEFSGVVFGKEPVVKRSKAKPELAGIAGLLLVEILRLLWSCWLGNLEIRVKHGARLRLERMHGAGRLLICNCL